MVAALVFYTFLFLLLVVAPAGLILVVLLFLDHERRVWKRVTPFIGPIARKMAQRPGVLGLRKRFPRITGFVIHRLDPHDSWGLSWTVAVIAITAGLWFFIGVTAQIVAKDPLVTLDLRLHNAVPLFRTIGMTWFMLALTTLGSPLVLSLLCLGSALLASAWNRRRLAATLILALAASGIVSTVFKVLLGHARPIDAIIGAHAASFPSGHMLSSTVIYGLLAAQLLSSHVRPALRGFGVTFLLLLIVGIGLSRLYLGVHWPSDLLGSLGLALVVLACALFFLHYSGPVRWIDTFKIPLGTTALRVAGCSVLVLALGATTLLPSRTQMLPIGPPQATRPLGSEALRTSYPSDLPRWSEDLVGGRMEPVSLVLVGSEEALLGAFTQAGWTKADLPTPVRVVQEGLAALRNLPDVSGPATPAFLADRPQTLTFEKPDSAAPSIRRRHHTRVWRTGHCLAPRCRPVWVATASYDVGVRFSQGLHLPTHRIDSAIDNERALIVTDLTRIGAKVAANVTVTPPLQGTNAAGDPFWTDGRAVVLDLP